MPVLRDMGKWNHDNMHINGRQSYYKNTDAVENVIRYILRERYCETRRPDLISYGGAGIDINASAATIINQFLAIQNLYKIDERGGRRLVHEVYSFSDEEFKMLGENYALVDYVAREISAYFYAQGFQIVYAIHNESGKRVHIHFVMNTINFRTGKKFVSRGEDFKYRLMFFNQIFRKVCGLAIYF